MHLPKTFLRSFFFSFFLVSLVLSAPVFAAPTGGTIVATVNIRDAVVTSQQGNVINGVFTINNGDGVQSGVRYGVQLFSETPKGKVLVDEKVFDEVLTLAENSSARKSFSYTAPSTLTGSYQLLLTSKNADNFPFAFSPLGKITLTASEKGLVIDPESCSIKLDKASRVYSLKEVLTLSSPAQTVILTCTATNTSTSAISATPTVITKSAGAYGEVVQTAPVVTTALSFKAGEKKIVSIVVPLAQKPQTYVASLSFNIGAMSSNSVSVSYMIRGVSASISNLSLDNDFYKRGEVAALSIVWLSSSPNLTLFATLTNGSGMKCAKDVEQNLTGTVEVLFSVKSSCRDPQVKATIKDSAGTVLDEKAFSVKSPKTKGYGDTMPFVVLVVLAALVIIGVYIKKHKKASINTPQNTTPTNPMRALLPIIIIAGLASLIPFSKANADTYTSTVNGSPCISSWVDIVDRSYTPPTLDIRAQWLITNNCSVDVPVTLQAVNNINAVAPAVNPSAILQNPITLTAFGGRTGGGFISENSTSFDAPSATGTYKIQFETGVDVPIGSTIYVAVTELTSDSGSRSMLCSADPFNPSGSSYHDYPYSHTTYRADFFSDPQATIPLDVTGLGLRLYQEHSINIPVWISTVPGTEYVYTPVLSGTSYTYDGPSYDNGYTDGYGADSCDQQTTVYGYNTLDGSAVTPVPYQFVPAPPFVNMSAPAGVYQGTPFSISWSSSNATSCVGTGFSTGGSLSGTVSVTQSSATTYTISCSNVLGTDNKSLTVGDWGPPPPPPPTCNGWPGVAIQCDAPSYCENDFSHPGYEVCQF